MKAALGRAKDFLLVAFGFVGLVIIVALIILGIWLFNA